MLTVPLISETLARMPRSPYPSWSPSGVKPSPSSRTSRRTASGSYVITTSTERAPAACLRTLAAASCIERSRTTLTGSGSGSSAPRTDVRTSSPVSATRPSACLRTACTSEPPRRVGGVRAATNSRASARDSLATCPARDRCLLAWSGASRTLDSAAWVRLMMLVRP